MVLALPLLGCSASKDDVALSVRLSDPRLSVSDGRLIAALDGSFELVLALGEYAPRATTVSAPSFDVQRGDVTLVETLDVTPSEPFPLTLEAGDQKTVRFSVSDGEGVDEEQVSALCSGPVQIRGSVTDTLNDDKPTPITSAPFQPDCP